MQTNRRKLIDRSFTISGWLSIVLLTVSLLIVLGPIVVRGSRAFIFRETIERRKMLLEQFNRGNPGALAAETKAVDRLRRPVYDAISEYEKSLSFVERLKQNKSGAPLFDLKEHLRALLGPFPSESQPILLRDRYGETRWDSTLARLNDVLYTEEYEYPDPTQMGVLVRRPRNEQFAGTPVETIFPYIEQSIEQMMRPRLTLYWRFLADTSKDAHFFGGVWAELLGTIYLTVGAMIFAVPMGVLSAIYFVEYSGDGRLVSLLRTFISTLAGVPSIVYGLFGLAFFINTIHVSEGRSVLAGSLTLGLLVLPLVIRASEEAIRTVPHTYKEAALSLGAGRWRTILTVLLPAALPGILTGIVISMGRAAGETAPIIFTAAVSMGKPLKIWNALTTETPALPWNIYNLCSEHQAVDEIRHVQYGMVLTLVGVVLFLNIAAIILRARIARKLKG